MDRRTYLGITGGALTSGLAGCSGGAGQTATSTTTSTTSTTTTTTTVQGNPEKTREYLRKVGQHYRDALAAFRTETQTLSALGSNYGYDTDTVDRALEQANEDLAVAEENATPDQQELIDYIRQYGSLIRDLTDTVDLIVAAYSAFSTANSYFKTARYDDAIAKLGTVEVKAGASLSSSSNAIETTKSLEEPATDAFDLRLTTVRNRFEDLKRISRGLLVLAVGGQPYAQGAKHYGSAVTAYNNQNYQTAGKEFSAASNRFQAAYQEYKKGEEKETMIKNAIIERTCRAKKWADASSAYSEAANYASQEKWTEAQESVNKANQITNRSCSV